MKEVLRVRQALVSRPLADVEGAVRRALDGLGLRVPRGEVAVTAGSRGIDNIVAILRTAGAWLRERGAHPFLAPCMGSHNGGTAAGQRAMLASLGITEAATGMPVRATMDTVTVGEVATGSVHMDRHCHAADAVLVVNRVKLHTCFAGPYQSGLVKMMVVGMGKTPSARTFHSAPQPAMKEMLPGMARCILDSGKILAGLAILEDGFDRTAELHALAPETILEREPALLERHRRDFPRLPADALEVLVVGEIGKTFSGTGMDTNVIGRRGVRGYEDLDRPAIRVIAALGLAPASRGNAIGVGLADFITRRLREAIDERKTFVNVYTTGDMDRMKIPATLADDRQLVQAVADRYGTARWMFIPNTLRLGTLYVSPDLGPELAAHPRCTVDDRPVPLRFRHGRLRLDFDPPGAA